MKPVHWILSLVILVAPATTASAVDRVRLVEGGSASGTIQKITRDAVTIETIDRTIEVPVIQIRAVLFDDEPSQLGQARINTENGGYETALEKLNQAGDDRSAAKGIQQDLAYYRAYCAARLAMGGEGEATQAGRALTEFVRENPDSYHYYAAVEALGDLLVSIGREEQAERTYAQIAKAPSLGLKARSALLIGRSLQSRGEHEDALRRFDALLAAKANEPGIAIIQQAAQLAKAESLAATGDLEGGLKLTRDAIRAASAQETAALAAGYNTLGRCYEEADRSKDALFAYLHTDLLFNSDPATHAEALAHLAKLWRSVGKPDEASDAAKRLRRQYAASPQAREVR
ncbi:hypothetical protein Pla108_12540 [Botrimarina colliarenosi]|uniref:Tetratricopeptide repeat protein n=1 Tax=Botrimarina colliarenosi TaxID=2528001 RepID=A0A5C6AJT3_9BACT|nr:hypothetical protein [Botrimarina colliarenosi]TWU00305.1 hypothetical protein Pla108_12540 [Botrimarina colliarenosi]